MGTGAIVDLAPDEKECFRQLFFSGPTWDGDIVSKAGRAGLIRRGYCIHRNGWAQLTEAGFEMAVAAKLGDDKEAWANKRMRESNDNHRALCAILAAAGGEVFVSADARMCAVEKERIGDGLMKVALGDEW